MRKIKKLTIRIFIALIALSLLAVPVLYLIALNSPTVSATWYDDSWGYRKRIDTTIVSNSSDLSNLQMLLTVDTSTSGIASGKMQSSCQDLRFTNTNGKVLPYYIDSGCTTTATKIWVMVDLVPKNTTSMTLFMYYGNPSAPQGSNSQPYFDNVVGLVGYWNMNESSWNGTSGEVKDMSVNGNNGTASGNATTTSSGKYSNAGTFDGSGDYVNAGTGSSLNITSNQVTMSAWVYPTASQQGVIIGKWLNSAGYTIQLSSTNKFQIVINGSGWQGTGTVSLNQWSHVVGVYDGSNMKLYINGVFQQQFSLTGNINDNSSVSTYIGQYVGGGDYEFTGQIDDVKIYNTARTATQILNDYNNKLPNGQTLTIASTAPTTVVPTSPTYNTEEKAPSPIAYWKFDDSQGQTAQDSTTNNNDGTLGATSGSSTDDPTWQTEDMCVSGKCLKFDGGDYVGITNNLTISSGTTAEAWFRSPDTGSEDIILGWGDSSYVSQFILNLSNNKLLGKVRDQNSNQVILTTDENYNDNQWHHVVLAKNGNNVTLYVDGKQKKTGSTTFTTFAARPIQIGQYQGLSTTYLTGFIDEVKIYPYARSSAQILADYNSRGNNEGASSLGGPSTSSGRPTLSDGLVGYWKMDEGSWTNDCSTATVTDSSGNGNTGKSCPSSTGPTGGTAGKYSNSGNFDNVNDYVSVPYNSSLNTSNAVTLSAWVKTTSVSRSDVLARYGGYAPFNGYALTIGSDYGCSGAGTVGLWVGDNTNRYLCTTATVNDGSWHFITGTYDGITVRIYIDGALSTTGTRTNGLSETSASLNFGTESSLATKFNGFIDETRIYNRALSPSEVSALYNFAPGPVGYWKMDDKVKGNSQTIVDSSGNGNNGTTNWGANAANMNCQVSGKYGGGCQFDGTDDYIDAGTSVGSNFKQGLTASAWFKTSTLSGNHEIVRNDNADGNRGFFLRIDGNKLTGYIHNGSVQQISGTTVLSINTWYYGTVTYNGSTLKVYLNGVEDGSSNVTGNITPSSTTTYIGYAGQNVDYWSGSLDDVKIYNYARSQKQVIEDMGGGHPGVTAGPSGPSTSSGRPAGPVGYWKFDEGHSTTANNSGSGGSALNGTLTGMATAPSTTTSGWTQAGKFGRALNFDGSDDYVDLVLHPSISPTQ